MFGIKVARGFFVGILLLGFVIIRIGIVYGNDKKSESDVDYDAIESFLRIDPQHMPGYVEFAEDLSADKIIQLFLRQQEDAPISYGAGLSPIMIDKYLSVIVNDDKEFGLLIDSVEKMSQGNFFERKAASSIAFRISRLVVNDRVLDLMDSYLDRTELFDRLVGAEMFMSMMSFDESTTIKQTLLSNGKRLEQLELGIDQTSQTFEAISFVFGSAINEFDR